MPTQSPDLNLIEHIWDQMKCKLEDKACKNLEELEQAVLQCWQDIDSDTTANFISCVGIVVW